MEVENEVKFTTGEDGVKFTTQSNGDIVIITGIHLTKDQAASLAYLVNCKKKLSFEVKEID